MGETIQFKRSVAASLGFPLVATLLGLLQHQPVAGAARLACCSLALMIAAIVRERFPFPFPFY